jgi:diguanylate cyclase (GGDEF)-like protein/PAS domain S-box-containing protein
VAGALYLLVHFRRKGQIVADSAAESATAHGPSDHSAQEAFWEWNLKSGRCFFSPRLRDLLNLHGDRFPARWSDFMERLHDEDRAALIETTRNAAVRQSRFALKIRVRNRIDGFRWFEIEGNILADSAGRVLRMGGTLVDVHDLKVAQLQLSDERSRLSALMEVSGEGLVVLNRDGCITHMNAVAESMTGYSAEEARGHGLWEVCRLVDEAGEDDPDKTLRDALRDGRMAKCSANLLLTARDGLELPVSQTIVPMRDPDGSIDGAILGMRDLSRERNFTNRLETGDRQDASSHLVSRREFNRRIAFVLERARATGRYHAVAHFRLDPFRKIVATCGRAAGDELLRQMSRLLRELLRDGDTLARLNEGEFGVLLENCPPEHAFRLATRALDNLRDFAFTWHYRTYLIGAQIGLVNLAEDLYALKEVVTVAELACQRAAEMGRNALYVYQPTEGEAGLLPRQGDAEWIGKIHKAIEENRLRLFFQPVVRLSDRNAEAEFQEITVRFPDSEGRMVTASEFIGASERFAMGPQLDRWVVRSVFLTLALRRERSTSLGYGRWSINLSAASVVDPGFASYVQEQFIHYGVPYQCICFELTEKAISAGMAQAQGFIAEFRAKGCRFALDQFGAGMALFSQLKVLHVDYLKIDGAFIKGIKADAIDVAMVKAVSGIAAAMGIKVIAEFVETDAAIEALTEIGVQLAQGNALGHARAFDMPHPIQRPRLRVVQSNT